MWKTLVRWHAWDCLFNCPSSRVDVSLEISCKGTQLKVRFSLLSSYFVLKVFMKCGNHRPWKWCNPVHRSFLICRQLMNFKATLSNSSSLSQHTHCNWWLILWSHSYFFLQSAYSPMRVRLRLGVRGGSSCIFLTIVCFCKKSNWYEFHTKSPLCKIVTFSHEIKNTNFMSMQFYFLTTLNSEWCTTPVSIDFHN